MENTQLNDDHFWQFTDQLRLHTTSFSSLSLGDSIWNDSFISNRRNEDLRNTNNNNNNNVNTIKNKTNNLNQTNNSSFGWKNSVGPFNKEIPNKIVGRRNVNYNEDFSSKGGKKKTSNNNVNNNNNSNNNNDKGVDKRFKTLPAAEALPRSEAVGGYIFVCNNDTMPENLQRMLFGLPPRYRDSVRAITPGLPLFLYNYSTHQLHGIYQAASFGGTNIDPSAWEDKKCPGESRFPAQVRATTRKMYGPLEEEDFRPILHHYDGPKFRLELSVPEALALLDKFEEKSS